MLGGIGHALVSAVEEAVFFHGIARQSQPAFVIKGDDPLTEHYSALGPEVGGGRNDDLIARLARVRRGRGRRPGEEPLRRLDGRPTCSMTSPPTASTCSRTAPRRSSSPGAVDYTEEANAAFERFAARGAHVVQSTDPLETWL